MRGEEVVDCGLNEVRRHVFSRDQPSADQGTNEFGDAVLNIQSGVEVAVAGGLVDQVADGGGEGLPLVWIWSDVKER
jgi:hypothetical protein